MRYANGARYVGQWVNGRFEGEGTYYFSNGDIYEGHWRNDKQEGQGKLTQGDRYFVGEFKDNRLNGYASCYNKGRKTYEGEYKNGKLHGYGTEYYIDGSYYQGDFENGLREGNGVLYFADGDKFVGRFSQGKRNGRGTYYCHNGSRYEGEYKDGLKMVMAKSGLQVATVMKAIIKMAKEMVMAHIIVLMGINMWAIGKQSTRRSWNIVWQQWRKIRRWFLPRPNAWFWNRV